MLNLPSFHPFEGFYMDPIEIRKMFSDLGGETVVGFQSEIQFTEQMNIYKKQLWKQ
jgi:ATP sulfurylase